MSSAGLPDPMRLHHSRKETLPVDQLEVEDAVLGGIHTGDRRRPGRSGKRGKDRFESPPRPFGAETGEVGERPLLDPRIEQIPCGAVQSDHGYPEAGGPGIVRAPAAPDYENPQENRRQGEGGP